MEESYFNRLPKDVIMKLSLDLNDRDLENYCRSYKKLADMTCNNYVFWINKILKNFGWRYQGEKTLSAIKKKYSELKYWWNPNNHWDLTDKFILETPGLLCLKVLNAQANLKITDKSVKELKAFNKIKCR